LYYLQKLKKQGSILVNKTTDDFNQSIPTRIITILFTNPVNLSNLHQSWLINKTRKSSSNLMVAIEIYFASIQPNFTYVNET
jgi:hypothetical protein